jgi:hypothetical protein
VKAGVFGVFCGGGVLRCGLILLLFLTLLPSPVLAVALSDREVAVAEARAFAALLDQRRYVDAWRVGTRYLQARLPVERWQQILRSYREPLGRVRARRVIAVRHLDRFETDPPGSNIQVNFRSTFGRSEYLERLVVRRDGDGRWRITGYQLR